jgi:hypothetical protein
MADDKPVAGRGRGALPRKHRKQNQALVETKVSEWIDKGGKPKTPEEVRAKLLAIRDGALDWCCDLVSNRFSSGLACAFLALQRANAEIDRLDEKEAGRSGQPINLLINNLDVSRLQFGNNLDASAERD